MERMALNLTRSLKLDAKTAQRTRADLVARVERETDIPAQLELVTELSQIDDGSTVAALCGLLAREQNPRVREQEIAITGFMAATPAQMKGVCAALLENYQHADARER